MDIRSAVPADAPVVASLVGALLAELGGSPLDAEAEAKLLNRAGEMLADESVIAFLAFGDERAIGVVTLTACSAIYAGRFGELTELYVAPEQRSCGVGEALLSACVRFAIDRQWERLEVGTPHLPEWSRTEAFYLKHGFSSVGARMKRELKQQNA